MNNDSFIYGPANLSGVVGVEPRDGSIEIYTQHKDGTVTSVVRPYSHWMLTDEPIGEGWARLKGDLHYKWIKTFRTKRQFWDTRKLLADSWCAYDDKEAAMLLGGYTYYRGLKLEDVGVLASDIEATGLERGPDSKVLLITNTYRKGAHVERKTFAYDEYATPAEMFDAWTAWVRACDPSIIVFYNGYDYDVPYLDHCARMAGTGLALGRDGSDVQFNRYESRFRKDGSQDYTYRGFRIYGREFVDGLFLAYKYDQATRKYDNYKLKTVVNQEGLEAPDRQHYDGASIGKNYLIPEEWVKIKRYAEQDADDCLNSFYRQAPAYYYWTRSVPKPFQSVINGASGSQINSFLIRSYLTEAHSVPAASPQADFEGAISIGNPGIYRNVFKADIASMYPSIILTKRIEDRQKDPLGHFQKMMQFFTAQRIEHKRLGKTDPYYKALSEAEKIVINSGYGFLGAKGLNFNSPTNAALVTEVGREILTTAIRLVETSPLSRIVNADTDSVSVASEVLWTAEEREKFLLVLNHVSPPGISWEDDGLYESVVVLKAKNYLMRASDGKITIKGSAFKGSQKEPALKEFMRRLTTAMMDGSPTPAELYNQYVSEILNLTDIGRWSSKKTVTEKVLNPIRTNEQRILDALEDAEVSEGDKVLVYFRADKSLKLAEEWTGDHDPKRLLKKLHETVKIFDTVLDVKGFPNYSLKRHREELALFSRPIS